MKILLLLGVLLAVHAVAQDTPPPEAVKFNSAAALAANFRQLSTSLAAGHKPVVPDGWQVQTPDGPFDISSDGLTALLDKKPNPDVNGARQWLELRAEQLEQFDSATPVNIDRARTSMQEILSRPEFAPEKPPGVMELLRRKNRQLDR